MATTPANDTKINIKNVRLSYVHLLSPFSGDTNAEKKYSVVLIVPKTELEQIKAIKSTLLKAYENGVANVWKTNPPKIENIKIPLRDGDKDRAEDDAFKGCYFINANSKTKPGIIDRNREDLTDPLRESEVYSGMYATVSVTFYAYDAKGNRGIACGLNNVLKVKDGPFLGGRSSATDDFAEELEKGESVKKDESDPFASL